METDGLASKTIANKLDLESVKNSCRVCSSKGVDMICMFDNEQKNVIDRIQFCTGVLFYKEDGLPSRICKICLFNLSVAHKFKTTCLLADNMFRKFMKTVIKTEISEQNIKRTYIKDDIKEDEHKHDGDDYGGNMVIDKFLVAPVENNLGILKTDISSVQSSELRIVRKKRGPYKKTRILKNKKIKSAKSLKLAMKVKLDPLSCDRCKVKFENKEQVIMHKKDHHRDTECWVCEICGKVLTHRASHYSHVRSHAPPQYACAKCDYKTWYKHDLVKHVRRHDGIKLFQCEYCTASYYTSSNLINHIRRIHDGEKRYQCTMCDKRFYDRAKLNRHIDSHNDVKRFKCDVCNACFTRRCYWKKHLLRQHNVVTPPQRPGRQKINFIVGQHLIDNTTTLLKQ